MPTPWPGTPTKFHICIFATAVFLPMPHQLTHIAVPGKPETVCTLEQLIDKAAFELNIDRTELRRINFVMPQDLPYSMLNGHTIDSGDFESLLDRALELSNWDSFPARRKQASRQSKLRGIGLGMYMHSTGGAVSEVCQVKLDPNGSVIVYSGTQSGGQGHASALAGLVADAMEISASMVTVIQGDTDEFARRRRYGWIFSGRDCRNHSSACSKKNDREHSTQCC